MDSRHPRLAATTTVSTRYQTVIPSEIREKFAIHDGSRIAWIDKGDAIEVVPVPDKPWQQFRGAGRGQDYAAALAEYRAKERETARSETKKDMPESGGTK